MRAMLLWPVLALLLVSSAGRADDYEIQHFDMQPRDPFPGEPVIVSWGATSGMELRIEPQIGALPGPSGALAFFPETSGLTYALIGVADGVEVARAEVGPIVIRGPEVSLEVHSATVYPHARFELAVICEGCDLVGIDGIGTEVALSERTVFPAEIETTTVFTARGSNAAGESVAQLSVSPDPIPPEVSLEITAVSGDVPRIGVPLRFHGRVEYARTAIYEPYGAVHGNTIFNYIEVVEEPTVFRLWAENAYGASVESVAVGIAPPTVELTGSEAIFPGETFELELVVSYQDEVTLEPIFGVVPGSGTYSSTLDSSQTFVATARNAAGTTTATWHVGFVEPEIRDFRALATELVLGESTRLVWDVRGTESVEILADGELLFDGLSPSGSLDVTPTQTTEYALRARNVAGASAATARVTVAPLVIQSFAADPDVVDYGAVTTLTWRAVGVGDLELQGFGPVELEGSREVVVEQPAAYVLIARVDGDEVDRATVVVGLNTDGEPIVRWSWSPEAYVSDPPEITAFAPFEAWVIADDVNRGLLAFEVGVDVAPELIILEGQPVAPGSIAVLGHPDWLVGTGACLESEFLALLHYRFLASTSSLQGAVLGVRGVASNPSFVTGEPAYSDCGDLLRPLRIGAPLVFDGGGPPVSNHDETPPDRPTGPRRSSLRPNVPNPFNPSTALRFELATDGPAHLAIYDVSGRSVRSIDLGVRPAGEGSVLWNGRDETGRPVGSGTYLVRLTTADGIDARRILLLK